MEALSRERGVHRLGVIGRVLTPTVGVVCQRFSTFFTKTRGMYFTPDDKGHIIFELAKGAS